MMKKLLVLGMVLVMTMSCTTLVGCANQKSSSKELVVEAYLVERFGDGDYEIEITKVDDEAIYFNWDNGVEYGYTHCAIDR